MLAGDQGHVGRRVAKNSRAAAQLASGVDDIDVFLTLVLQAEKRERRVNGAKDGLLCAALFTALSAQQVRHACLSVRLATADGAAEESVRAAILACQRGAVAELTQMADQIDVEHELVSCTGSAIPRLKRAIARPPCATLIQAHFDRDAAPRQANMKQQHHHSAAASRQRHRQRARLRSSTRGSGPDYADSRSCAFLHHLCRPDALEMIIDFPPCSRGVGGRGTCGSALCQP